MPPCLCSALYHVKKSRQKSFASSMLPKRPGKPRVVLDRLELRLRVRVVVRDPGSAQRLCDAQVGEQLRRALARHGRSPVRVKREHAGLDTVLQAALLDQASGQPRGLPLRHHPPCDVAAVDVQNDVEVEVLPLLRPEEPRDVPGPRLVGRAGHHLGLRMVRVAALGPALPDRLVLGQDAGTSCAPNTDRRPRPAASRTLPRERGPRSAASTAPRRPRCAPLRSGPGQEPAGAAAARSSASGDGRTWRARPRGPRTPRSRPRARPSFWPRSRALPVPEAQPQQPRYFSLDLDHDVRLAEFLPQPRVLPLELPYLLRFPLPARRHRAALLAQLP